MYKLKIIKSATLEDLRVHATFPFSDLRAPQSYRIFNTWMGDPGKLLLLKGVVDVINKENLLEQVRRSGDRLLSGLKQLQGEFPALISRARGRGTFLAISCSNAKLRDDMVGRLKAKGQNFLQLLFNLKKEIYFIGLNL